MATNQEPALDEVVWRAPQLVQQMGGIHTNTIQPYFSQSPFFDQTSNNATISTQAMYNPNLYYLIQTREAFEGRLRSMQGLEFLVTHDPSENDTKREHSGIWVIRKQNRRKRPGSEDEIMPISSYFVFGENVYMAPTISSILSSRLVSTCSSLTKFLSVASPLPLFTPSVGHTYLPPTAKSPSSVPSTQAAQMSKESTPMPGTQEGTPMPRLSSFKAPTANTNALQTLSDSLTLSLTYGNEYMDTNPLVGEPGSFRVTKSREEKPKAIAKTETPFKAAERPKEIQTQGLGKEARKGSKGGEKSPITPGAAIKGDKKRRKSKAAGATMTTPK